MRQFDRFIRCADVIVVDVVIVTEVYQINFICLIVEINQILLIVSIIFLLSIVTVII